MFFVQDDQPQTRHRCEDRAPRTYDDMDFAVRNPSPMPVSFDRRKMAVKNGDVFKPSTKSRQRLRRQTDFGNEHNRLPTEGNHFLDRLQIELGFAAPRNPVHKDRAMLLTVKGFANRLQGFVLLWI